MPEPLVVQIANEYRAALIAGDLVAQQTLTQRWLQVEAAIESELLALVETIDARRADGKPITQAQLFRLERYQSLLAQLQRAITRYTTDAARVIDQSQQAAAVNGLAQAQQLLQAAGAVRGTFTQLNTDALEQIVAIARSGQPLSTLLNAASPLAAEGITRELLAGVAIGRNPRETARRILDQGASMGLNQALLLSRDQAVRAQRAASQAQYQRSGVVSSYRRLAAKQRRTCLACLALDGTTYPTNELMPTHPGCRCTLVPTVRGLRPIPFETGAAWFERQSPETQREMLGPGRFEAYQKQRFSFGQLATVTQNDTWGPSNTVTPLKELV